MSGFAAKYIMMKLGFQSFFWILESCTRDPGLAVVFLFRRINTRAQRDEVTRPRSPSLGGGRARFQPRFIGLRPYFFHALSRLLQSLPLGP